ncbi:hypothetical protein PV326_002237 [Microctonus aethiopoides]|nr:hypothetical protein PV326_002237 [Microctonus aethiopoides]
MANVTVTVEWLNNKIDRLNIINDEIEKKDELDLIEIKLKSLTTLELDNAASNIDLGRLFSHITSISPNDRLIIDRFCGILNVLFAALSPNEIFQQYSSELVQHLSHHDSAVKKLVLNQFVRMADEKHPQLLTNVDLLNKIVEAISDNDIGVAQIAMGIIKKIGIEPNSTNLLYSGLLLRTIAKMVVKNDAASFRVYDVIIHIAKSSERCLQASINSGLIDSLINMLDNEDVLLQLNALDALGDLAVSDGGLNYMEQRELLSNLDRKIARASEDPFSNLLIPGLMKFFGNIAKNHPNDIFTKYPRIIGALFDIFEAADDMIILMNALDTLGHIASTVEGKYALDNLHDAMPSVMKKMKNFISNMPTEVRLRALDSLASILHVDQGNHNNRILLLTKSWFDLLHDDPVLYIVEFCKQPFIDIRLSSMKVLLEIATQYWGQEYIANHPGLMEFLMNRRAETDSQCKIIKYEIVKALTTADCFDATTIEQLKQYVLAGPLAIDIDTEVATESGGNA